MYPGSRDLVVRFSRRVDPTQLSSQAGLVASDALDLLLARNGHAARIGHVPDTGLIWWIQGGTESARLTHRAALATSCSGSATALDATGKPRPQVPDPEPLLHESFRYFRLSQTTDSLFDAFRNAYLALESVLTDLESPQPKENETDWLMRALHTGQTVAGLDLVMGCSSADVPRRFMTTVYERVRCRLFHGKTTDLDPASGEDRELVLQTYRAVVQCFLLLASERFRFRQGGSGGLTGDAFTAMGSALAGTAIMVGSGNLVTEPELLIGLRDVPMPKQFGKIRFRGRIAAPFDARMAKVNLVLTSWDGAPTSRHPLAGTLETDGLRSLEVVLEFWNRIDLGYRTHFPG
jgi:hypothetical protein